MRIIEQTSERLKTRHYPINSWVVGGFCLCVALHTLVRSLVWEPTSTVLNCTRQTTSVTCQLQQQTFIGIQQEQTLEAVRSVKGVGGGTNRPIWLVAPTQTLPVSNSSSRRDTFNTIQTFLNTPSAKSLTLRYDQPTAILFAPIPILLFGGLGLALLLLSVANTCTFDKTQNQIILKSRTLMDPQASIETYPLSGFQDIEIESYATKIGQRYNLLLVITQEKPPFHRPVVKKLVLSVDAVAIIALNDEQATSIEETIEAFVLSQEV